MKDENIIINVDQNNSSVRDLVEAKINNKFNIRDKIEVQYLATKGGMKWIQAKITNLNNDGTYDIDYIDGVKEKSVEEKYIRLINNDNTECNVTFYDNFFC